jgi:acyl carrier protein
LPGKTGKNLSFFAFHGGCESISGPEGFSHGVLLPPTRHTILILANAEKKARIMRAEKAMTRNAAEIKNKLREFLTDNFLLGKASGEIGDKDSFLESGIVDSTGILEFVGFLQDTWSIEVADEELLPENFDSLENLTAFVLRKSAG